MVEDIRATNNFAMKLTSTPGLTYSYSHEIVSPLRLSLITKTRIRGLDAFTSALCSWPLPLSLGVCTSGEGEAGRPRSAPCR
jgi:hypothetical protein